MKFKRIMRDIDDDIDDLFRRAAEGYPLNTNSSDWSKVQNAMQSSEDAGVQNVKSKKKYRRFLWLLLLLPFTFIIDKYAFRNHDKSNGITQQLPASSEQKNIPSQKNDNRNINKGEEIKAEKEEEIMVEEMKPASLKNKKHTSPSYRIIQKKNSEIFNGISESKNIQDEYSFKQNIVADTDVLAEQPGKPPAVKPAPVPGETKVKNGAVEENKDLTGIENKNKNPTTINKDFEITENTIVDSTNINKEDADPKDKEVVKVVESIPVVDDTLQINKVSKAHKQTDLRKSKSHFFYIGVVAGPDLSTVKLDKIIKTGFTLGVITGYSFNKRVSVESGLLLDKKYYYSAGKYFNTKNVYLPYHGELDNVDGYCNMIELPFNLKYNLKSNNKVNWFAVAGISSYFMNKENYDYRYRVYGQQKEGNLSSKDASKILASVMNIRLGYSHNVGKTGAIRVEPYIKIPFRGIGIGSLPITSSGIYLGFTKNLF
jgi:hypothetical protein